MPVESEFLRIATHFCGHLLSCSSLFLILAYACAYPLSFSPVSTRCIFMPQILWISNMNWRCRGGVRNGGHLLMQHSVIYHLASLLASLTLSSRLLILSRLSSLGKSNFSPLLCIEIQLFSASEQNLQTQTHKSAAEQGYVELLESMFFRKYLKW